MDPTVPANQNNQQNQPIHEDQPGGQLPSSNNAQSPQASQNTQPHIDQEAVKRGDIPMQSSDSIIKQNLESAADLQNVQTVNSAQVVNNDIAQKEIGSSESSVSATHASTTAAKSSDQIRALAEKIEQTSMPEEFKEELLDRISRLALIRSSAGFLSSTYIMEYETTSRFINWVVSLPWGKKTEDQLDLRQAKEIMDKNHYGLGPLKQRVLEYIASLMLNVKNYGNKAHVIKAPILCIVGLAGTGKTTFASSLADSLGRKFERIPFGGMADSRVLRGQSRYFPDAEPGQIIKRLVHAGSSNPVILLDELDRVTDTARADIMGVLIEILDPEQNARFTDHYIDYPYSLQNVLFIATANNVSSVATAVLDRLEIIQMPSYNDDEKINIGRDFVFPKTMQTTGLLPNQLTIDPGIWADLVRPLGYDPGIRGLDRLITGMCRKAAAVIVSGQAESVKITPDNVKQFLPEW